MQLSKQIGGGGSQLEAEQKKWFISLRRFSLEVGCDKILQLDDPAKLEEVA